MLLPMNMLRENTEATIKEINGGERLREKLSNIGLNYGEKFKIEKCSNSCNLIVRVNNSKYVLGFGIASKVMVEA